MSNYDEIAELMWGNGQLSMHGLSGLQPTTTPQEKPIISGAHNTLESIVKHATCQCYQPSKFTRERHATNSNNNNNSRSNKNSSIDAPYGDEVQRVPSWRRKRTSSITDNNMLENCNILSGCAGATFCRDKDITIMRWPYLESGPSMKTTMEEDSPSHCPLEIRDNEDDTNSKAEMGQSNLKRRSLTAAIHNQSERKRRDRINQKMKALQRLVPNANKTDKASMLDEVINYLKQLQAEIQVMNMRSMPQMMMVPLAMQQQLHMSMLARMGAAAGLGMGMGLVNMNNNFEAQACGPTSLLPQLTPQTTTVGTPPSAPVFVMPSMIQPHNLSPPKPQHVASSASITSFPFGAAGLTQPINMDILSNMAALYQQQMSNNNHVALSNSMSQPHHEQGR